MTSAQVLNHLTSRCCLSHHWTIPPNAPHPVHVDEPLTDEHIAGHLGGLGRRGACPMAPGESTTRLALLDFDSHKGETSWEDMIETATRVRSALQEQGLEPVPFVSSGGRGLHLFMLWNEPQDAFSVREACARALGKCGLANGTAGVGMNQVEIFPKQNRVPVGGCGSMFVLPLAMSSVPLDPELWEEVDEPVWASSSLVIVCEAPTLERVTAVSSGDLERVRSALAAIPDAAIEDWDYDRFIKCAMGVHAAAGGSEEGLGILLEFASRSSKYDEADTERFYRGFKLERDALVTQRSIFSLAFKHGWEDPATGPQEFEALPPLVGEEARKAAAMQMRNKEKLRRKSAEFSYAEISQRIDASGLVDAPLDNTVRDVIAMLVNSGVTSSEQYALLQALKVKSGIPLKALREDVGRARGAATEERGVDLADPVGTAKTLIAEHYNHEGYRTIARSQGQTYVWNRKKYVATPDETLRAKLYELYETHGVSPETRSPIDNAVDALRALSHLDSTKTLPTWIDGTPPAPPRELIACRNGLLHAVTRTLYPHDPRFFNLNAVDINYDTNAPVPTHWINFLNEVLPGDKDSAAMLQEWFGYCLTHDTSQQKAVICVGPKRSGKGTIARVLKELMGEANVCGPTLSSFGRQFGLQGLIGKLLAVVSDARVSGAADLQGIAETILRVTGQDLVSVERKNLVDWVGTLETRFMLLTNVLPGIVDAGGAIASRFILLNFTESFFGREDPLLTKKLLAELPGILNWALDGLNRLRERGAFVQPASGARAMEDLVRKTVPVVAFAQDVFEPGASGHWVSKDGLYEIYRNWTTGQGLKFVLAKDRLLEELYNNDRRFKTYRPRHGNLRIYAVRGAGLNWAGVRGLGFDRDNVVHGEFDDCEDLV